MIVGACVPARDEVHTSFAFDFAKMVGRDSRHRCSKEGNGLKLYTMAGTLIFDQREKLVDAALKEGCDAVLFIDSDMRFPADTIDILLSREVPIVGVNAVTRRKPTLPTALNLELEKDGEAGLQESLGGGFGTWSIACVCVEEGAEPLFFAGSGGVS